MFTFPAARGRWALLAAAAALAAMSLSASAAAASAPKSADALLRAINTARTGHGVRPLHPDRRLARAARAHSRDMRLHRYFAHESPSGARPSDRIARTGWMRPRARWRVGEVLEWRSGPADPTAVVAAWLASPPHRRVLLWPTYRVVGIGIVRGTPVADGATGHTYTADLGTGR